MNNASFSSSHLEAPRKSVLENRSCGNFKKFLREYAFWGNVGVKWQFAKNPEKQSESESCQTSKKAAS